MTLLRPAALFRRQDHRPLDARSSNGDTARPLFFLYASLLILLIALCLTVSAQEQPSPPENSDEDVLRVRTDLLTVPFFVTDARGRRVGGLSRADFTVRDDGRPVALEYFASGAERVALLFALDSSGSARDTITHQRETALALFSRFGKGSRVAVLRFTDKSELVVPFTTDTRQPREGFSLPAIADRHTAIFDAAASAVRAFKERESDPMERRIIVLISDGLDTVSNVKAETVINEARAAGISIYVIHLLAFAVIDGSLRARPAAKGFRELAERTGGAYFKVGDKRSALDPRAEYDLTMVFKAIEEDLGGQYVLGYYPGEAARDARPHRIEINLASSKRKLHVRSLRESYILKAVTSDK
jgi:Ca-activated chloride channel family protein